METFLKIVGLVAIAIAVYTSWENTTKPDPNNRKYETGYNSTSTVTTEEESPYIDNRLQTGSVPYRNEKYGGSGSVVVVSTSSRSECDVVVIIKHNGYIVRNAYIAAGDSYKFYVPNGIYQVFFYGGKGWSPYKQMAGGQAGGFVANESYSKDSEVSLDYQELSYELIPQANGNFSTQQSSASEMF
jgi:hypothetical protein